MGRKEPQSRTCKNPIDSKDRKTLSLPLVSKWKCYTDNLFIIQSQIL